MSKWPTIAEVVAWLNDRDQPVMALVVERLEVQLREAQAVSKHNYDACCALRAKYEPQPRREHSPTWTGD